MKVYVALDEIMGDTVIIGVFSTREKAGDYIREINFKSGYQYIVEKELDNPYAHDENP